jgi:hypothetical protein
MDKSLAAHYLKLAADQGHHDKFLTSLQRPGTDTSGQLFDQHRI